MRIESITIHAFGKFKDYEMVFTEGLNLIMGDNEAGKSTIHQFIEAMFFGFYKPYSKVRLYEEGYEKYVPWDHPGYGGTMTIVDDDRRIRFERQFYKGKDALVIYDVDTGEDITETYDYDKVTKMANIAIAHIGFNKITYKNTISLTQMQQRTQSEMVREIKDNMNNLASSHQSTISVERVLEGIAKEADAIGNMKRRTSPYYKLVQEIKALEEELVNARAVHEAITKEKEAENTLLASHEALLQKEKRIRRQIATLNAIEDKQLCERAKQLKSAVLAIEEQQKSLSLYKNFDVVVVSQLQKDKEVILKLETEKEKLEERKQYLTKEIEATTIQIDHDDLSHKKQYYEQLNRTVYSYEEDEKQQHQKLQEKQFVEQQRLMLESIDKPKPSLLMTIGLLSLGVIATILGFIYTYIMFGFVMIVGIAYMVVRYMDKQRQSLYEQYVEKTERFNQQLFNIDRTIETIESRMEAVLVQEEVRDLYELRLKRDSALTGLTKAEALQLENKQKEAKSIELKQELEGILRTFETLVKRQELLTEQYEAILKKYQIASSNAIQEALEKHHLYKSHEQEKQGLMERIKELLGGRTIESMERQLSAFDYVEVPEGLNKETLGDELEGVNKEMMVLREKLSEVMTRGTELAKSSRLVPEIEEALKEATAQKEGYDQALKVTGIMEEAVTTIARDIQNNFAPVLNEALSSSVQTMSHGKYKDIKVNPQMELTIFDDESHRTVKAESLSEGTVDMLYFGLRLGMGDVLSKNKKLPLILDDAFVQYDDKRLAGALALLTNKKRQVLLFTCHDREKNRLDALEESYKVLHI